MATQAPASVQLDVHSAQDGKATEHDQGQDHDQKTSQHPLLADHFLDILHNNFVRPHLSALVRSKSFFARQKVRVLCVAHSCFHSLQARHKDVIVPSGPQATAFATIFNLCKAMIGSGILGLAFSMRYTGVCLSPCVFVNRLTFRPDSCAVHHGVYARH